MTAIARIYGHEIHAREAIRRLQAAGFAEETWTLLSGGGAPAGGADTGVWRDVIAQAFTAGARLGGDAAQCAEAILRGHSVLIVEAPFGAGQAATTILDGCSPIGGAPVIRFEPARAWDEATPLSSAIGAPVLVRNAAPFSSFLSLPLLAEDDVDGPTLFPRLVQHDWTFSHYFGWRLLSDAGPAPFSAKFGWRLLSDAGPAPFSSKLGWPLLSRDATPLTSLLGIPTLYDNPAPFSGLFGFPLLLSKKS